MATAYLSLGANQGDPPAQLRAAARSIAVLPGTSLSAASSMYRTSPVGVAGQPDFHNAVLKIETSLPADELMSALLDIETELGRIRSRAGSNSPRRLDCDILLYDDLEIDTPGLQLPHPRMKDRLFVLLPLLEIEPEIDMPGPDSLEKLCDRARQAGQRAELIDNRW